MSKNKSEAINILGKPQILTMKDFFLESNSYQIPAYQRQYTWGIRQVEDFWNDLFKTVGYEFVDSKLEVKFVREHFLGNVFLKTQKESSSIEIVDGQQRITTSFLTIFALLNLINENIKNNEVDSEHVNLLRKYSDDLKRILYPQLNKNALRLKLGEIDDEYFTSIAFKIKKGEMDFGLLEKDLSSKKIIERNYFKIVQLIEFKMGELGLLNKKYHNDGKTTVLIDELKSLILIVEAILFALSKTLIITFNYITGDDGDSFLMFEAINARGKPLSQIDTIKNHLFGIAFNGDPESTSNLYDMAKQVWKDLIMTHDEKAEDLLYYFFAVEFASSKITQDKLYEFVVDYIRDSLNSSVAEVNNILVRLNNYIEVFKFTLNPNAFLFSQLYPTIANDKKISKIIQEIQFINKHEIMMPILLKTLYELQKNRVDIITASSIINSVVNLFIHVQLDENSISKFIELIPRFAREIFLHQPSKSLLNVIKDHTSKYDNQTYQKLLYDLSDRDKIVEKIVRSRNESLNKLILTKFEIHLRGTTEPILDSSVFWLEHIFPKKYSSSAYWQSLYNNYMISELDKGYDDSQVSKEFFEKYIENIGNMVITLDKVNSEVGIKPFKDKIIIYSKNDGYLLRDLVNGYGSKDFDTKLIQERAKDLSYRIYDSELLKID